ncbi:phage tail tape measure protein [Cognatishimia maritima]|uniref:Phage tail tape measure protein, lambda family n=1 Tax=Cognatishimia maritima TaxID=870908 RepID=A0A1M5JHF8_9RHOB|nr:phage tail tape measure protein [Cognatishimia maritima]SHG40036.1 phage tail tape measure protein, lambda family [Cognatishimia maritima]
MTDYEGMDAFRDHLGDIGDSAAATGEMLAAFDTELHRVRRSLQSAGGDFETFEKGMSKGLKKAVDGLVQDGDSLGDALRNVFKSVMDSAYEAAVTPVTDHFGALIARGIGGLVGGLMPFADGAAFTQGRVMPFANGGIVSQATAFTMRGGLGVMGEAGPEAIMPLARGADGKLGVRGGGGRPVQVVMNIQTSDVEGFRRSQGQIATQMTRAIARGQRNM